MKRYSIALGLLVIGAGLAIILLSRRPNPPGTTSVLPPQPAGDHLVAAPKSTPPPELTPSPASSAPTPQHKLPQTETTVKPARPRFTIKAGDPIPELFPYQAERQRLYDLASSADANKIPTIAASLKHQDATVREAARQALIQTGSAAAVPHLERVAAAAPSEEERELLREAIEFLSLPSFMDVITSALPPASGAPSTP